MIYHCCNENRRRALAGHPELNGIDYLEVLDDPGLPEDARQRTLMVYFVNPVNEVLSSENVRVEGGERVHDVAVQRLFSITDQPKVLGVVVNHPGDFSTYTLRVVRSARESTPPSWLDPVLSALPFSFKVECPSDFDCLVKPYCPPAAPERPSIDYLARDYASFRQQMLDRMALTLPDWRERHPADVGIMLTEVLAFVGDYLSYRQDAVTTESYLGTARRRISVRRHARLVDYLMHDGCNARTWVHLQVKEDVLEGVEISNGTQLFTPIAGHAATTIRDDAPAYLLALTSPRVEVFETMENATLYAAHNRLSFYTWGDEECCLPKGATSATLRGHYPHLKKGDVLIFKETLDPETGIPENANPLHRHALRLTKVAQRQDPLGGSLDGLADGDPVTVTDIHWSALDALPFPLCISARTAAGEYLAEVSIALGNIVLADHGRTIAAERLPPVPETVDRRVRAVARDRCEPPPDEPVVPARFNPLLSQAPITQAATTIKTEIRNGREVARLLAFDPDQPAASVFDWRMEQVLPALNLRAGDENWGPRRDLLASRRDEQVFVVEVETSGQSSLRFGDATNGMRPPAGATFTARYRVGNGLRGNIGAEALKHIHLDRDVIERVSNPLAARGGLDPEAIETVRQRAPYAFRTQERAVTADDYARVAERHQLVQRAAATFRWTGSWHTLFLTVDRRGGLPVDREFKNEMRRHLERYRMAGQDVEIDAPRFVSLEVEMHVCVKPDYFRSQVKVALLQVFSNRWLPDGARGLFHPDNFTFGQPVYLSRLYAAAQAVEGVAAVEITVFQRQGIRSVEALESGKLRIARLEIARLDNDRNFTEHGLFRLDLEGGR